MNITQLNKKAIAVTGLPANYSPVGIDNFSLPKRITLIGVVHPANKDAHKHWIDLPEGNWTIIGRAAELTEEDWKRVVECSTDIPGVTIFKDYDNDCWFDYSMGASESGHSLLKAEGLELLNPLILTQ